MPTPTPVLLMVRALDLGGTERQLSALATSLDRSKFEPHVACFRAFGQRRTELEKSGVPITQLAVRSFKSLSIFEGARQMIRYIHLHGIQIVHAFDYPTVVFGIPVARACSVRAISSQRYHRPLRPGWPHQLLRITDHMVDAVVVNCEYLARHMIEDERIPKRLVQVCYNGIDTGVFCPQPGEPRAPEVTEASLVIGLACVLRPEKNLEVLLEAFSKVRCLRKGLKLMIVGDGPCRGELFAQAQRLGILDDCLFLPASGDVAPYWRAMDIVVLPSISEALSNSLMEAMACGCCVAASSVGGNIELVADGRTGLLFDPRDVGQLVLLLQRLIEQKALRMSLASGAVRFIQDKFSLAASTQRMEKIYASVLERSC
jgi:glycosyltransferase involved in cell wall biosynthesis